MISNVQAKSLLQAFFYFDINISVILPLWNKQRKFNFYSQIAATLGLIRKYFLSYELTSPQLL